MDRSDALKIGNYPKFSKLKNHISKMKQATLSSKAIGIRDTKDINMEGRIQFDMLGIILREHKLRSYTLNSVSAHFLGEQKEDVHHNVIAEL
jgi:DNA polymerase delta subunit 1